MNQKVQKYSEIKKLLLKEITDETARGGNRLMPEAALAEKLGSSRTLIRDCLSSLEQDGFISRVHGVGTIINRHVVESEHRMDLEKEFIPTIQDAGYRAEILDMTIDFIPADEETARKLQIEPGSDVVSATRLVGADGAPAIYCIDEFPRVLCKKKDISVSDLSGSVYDFLLEHCGTELQMDIAELKVVRCDAKLADLFQLWEGDVLLSTYETGYDFFGVPRIYSKVFYKPGVMKHMIVRKKIS